MSEFTIKNHLLFMNNKGVTFARSPNVGSFIKPIFIVVHYTASQSSAYQVAELFSDPKYKLSCHLTLDMEGIIAQSVPFNIKAFHAGQSRWKNYINLNNYAIGIEVVNPGELTIVDAEKKIFKTWYGRTIESDEVIIAKHKNSKTDKLSGWLPFNSIQMEYLYKICEVLIKTYPIEMVLGHDMIAPERKKDPGPCCPDSFFENINKLCRRS